MIMFCWTYQQSQGNGLENSHLIILRNEFKIYKYFVVKCIIKNIRIFHGADVLIEKICPSGSLFGITWQLSDAKKWSWRMDFSIRTKQPW